jgi:hypothetical protein
LEVGQAPEKYFSLKVLTRELFYLRFGEKLEREART